MTTETRTTLAERALADYRATQEAAEADRREKDARSRDQWVERFRQKLVSTGFAEPDDEVVVTWEKTWNGGDTRFPTATVGGVTFQMQAPLATVLTLVTTCQRCDAPMSVDGIGSLYQLGRALVDPTHKLRFGLAVGNLCPRDLDEDGEPRVRVRVPVVAPPPRLTYVGDTHGEILANVVAEIARGVVE